MRSKTLGGLTLSLLAAGLFCVIRASSAAAAGSDTKSAALPDWSGFWRIHGSVATLGAETGKPFTHILDNAPLKPEYLAEYQANAERALKQGDPNATDVLTDTNTLNCFAGFPRLIAAPFGYIFFISPKKTYIVMDKAVRQIFTDGRDWPVEDMRWPLMLGRSKGRWEGDTLVIDTITMHDDMWLDPTPLMLSDQATVNERIRKISPDQLENRVTIHDPVKFTSDWHFVRHYDRVPENKDEWPDDPELCGGPNDRNPIVNGKVTVKLPADSPAK